MKRRIFLSAAIGSSLLLASCARKKKPYVELVVIKKSQRKMHLYHNGELFRSYDIGLGFEPVGHKTQEGDGKTPEGIYKIDRRNPRSQYFLSLGIDYPNANDRANASRHGVSPGGDIFIHGEPNTNQEWSRGRDWTAGCIAVSDTEMREIYPYIGVGTVVDIRP